MNFSKSRLVVAVYALVLFFALPSSGQKKPQKLLSFTQKDLNTYKFDENKYDLRSKDTYHYLRTKGDTTA